MNRRKDRTEITPRLRDRVNRLKKKARKYIAKSEILQFRLDAPSYEKLFVVAERAGKPVGTLVREWVNAKIEQELSGSRVEALPIQLSGMDPLKLVEKLKGKGPFIVLTMNNESEKANAEHILSLQKQINELQREVKRP